jgi:tetratricopeptide (TPR) repeat protein
MAEDEPPIIGPGSNPAAETIALGAQGTLDPRAAAYLEKQARLVDLQSQNLIDQNEFELSHLRWRRFNDQMKGALQIVLVAVGALVLAGFGVMIWNAFEDHGLVVEAFQVPPDLSARGLTGHSVASLVLDKLAAMQAATASERPAATYQNNWGDDLKVEIPETGISISDLNRFLRQSLGHQTRISGEVFRTQTGLTITARVGANAGDHFSGTDADLDRLLQQSAEAIYRRTQPYRMAQYLAEHDRRKEALSLLTTLADGPPGQDRIWADHSLQFALMDAGDISGAVARAWDATRIAPDNGDAWDGVGETERSLGHDEAALTAFEHALPLSRRNSDGESPGEAADLVAWQQAYVARYHGDFRLAAHEFERAAEMEPSLGDTSIEPLIESERDFGLDHDERAVDATKVAVQAADQAARARFGAKAELTGSWPEAELIADTGLGQWFHASGPGRAIQTLVAAAASPSKARVSGIERLKRSLAYYAYAKAMIGDMADAETMIRTTQRDCYDCLRMRGKIAAVARDWLGAERWFAECVRQAPSIPFAYADWGEMLLAKGDYDGAIAKFKRANEKGPRFADPLEYWGEVLIAKNRSDLALAKFAEADRYAPNWSRLHLKWGEALYYAGKRDEAKKQFAIARTLDLTPSEKPELAGVLHG